MSRLPLTLPLLLLLAGLAGCADVDQTPPTRATAAETGPKPGQVIARMNGEVGWSATVGSGRR